MHIRTVLHITLFTCLLLGILAGCAGTELRPTGYDKSGKPVGGAGGGGGGIQTKVFEF